MYFLLHFGEQSMKQKQIIGILIISAVVFSAAYLFFFQQQNVSDDQFNNVHDGYPDINVSTEMSFQDSANQFGFELLRQFKNQSGNGTNPFFSPYSLFTALAMAYEGAEGNTADEMADVLNIEQDNESFHQYVSYLYQKFNQNTKYNLSTANAAWMQKDFIILEDYIHLVENFYHAEANNIDFSNPEKAADIINQWVENQTNNLIHDLVPSTAINPALTKLILTNAIYFKGMWQVQFDPVNTTDRPFTLASNETIDVPMMGLTDTEDVFNYTETDEFQLLQLPYAGNDLSMIIILPKENTDVSSIINNLNEKDYVEWLNTMQEVELDVHLPKFTIETPRYSMSQMLKTLGIHDAFSSADADFSGITGEPNLYIKYVFHKAFIEVNEEGTEAAAATAVIMDLKAVPNNGNERIVFDCDHPFLYIIQENETGTILFMGTLDNPAQ